MTLWAFSSCRAARDDLAPQLDVSAWLAMISLPVNIVPFYGLKTLLATHMHTFIPQNNLLVAAAYVHDISRHSSGLCTLPETNSLTEPQRDK